MSTPNTPRTDAHCHGCECDQTPCVCADLLRQMERELAAMTAERDAARALLRDVARSGFADDSDPRIDWVDVQVDRDTWEAVRKTLTVEPFR